MVKGRYSLSASGTMNSVRACLLLGLPLFFLASASDAVSSDQLTDGKTLVMSKSKGNCLACHAIADGEMPGNIGPPLVAMKARFPDAEKLRRQIWDAGEQNPDSRMPPFGKNGILDKDEIDRIIEYLYTL